MPLIKLTEKYAVIPNHILTNPQLSFREKGLWVYLNSKPEGWDFSAKRISWDTKESEETINSYLNTLKDHGYLERKKQTSGRMDYILMDNPTSENTNPEKTQVGKTSGLSNTDLLSNTETEVNKEKDIKETEEFLLICEKIINYLNKKLNSSFRPTSKATQSKIRARLSEKYTLDDFYKCIDNMIVQWIDDEKMYKYLVPETLFSPKMEKYVNFKTQNQAYCDAFDAQENDDKEEEADFFSNQ